MKRRFAKVSTDFAQSRYFMAKKTILSCTRAGFCTTICSGAQFLNLKIDLEPDPLGVGGIFLHGWIHNQTAVPQGDNRFCSITTFHGEKSDFLLKMWCFGALPAHTKSTHKSKFLTAQNFPAHAALVQGLSLHKKGTHQVSGKSDKGF